MKIKITHYIEKEPENSTTYCIANTDYGPYVPPIGYTEKIWIEEWNKISEKIKKDWIDLMRIPNFYELEYTSTFNWDCAKEESKSVYSKWITLENKIILDDIYDKF